jgi:hypothetical protein
MISKKDEDTVMRGDRLSAIRIIRAETPYKDLHSALGLLDGLRSGHVGVEEVFGDSKKQQKPCPHCRGTGLVDDNFSEPR